MNRVAMAVDDKIDSVKDDNDDDEDDDEREKIATDEFFGKVEQALWTYSFRCSLEDFGRVSTSEIPFSS